MAGVGQAFLRAIVPLDSCRSLGEFDCRISGFRVKGCLDDRRAAPNHGCGPWLQSAHDQPPPSGFHTAGPGPFGLHRHRARAAQPARHLGAITQPERAHAGHHRHPPHRAEIGAAEPTYAAHRQQRRAGQCALPDRCRWPSLPAGGR